MYLKTYKVNACTGTYEPTLLIDAAFEKIKVELELLTTIDMLLRIEKCSKDGMCHAIHRYVKTN